MQQSLNYDPDSMKSLNQHALTGNIAISNSVSKPSLLTTMTYNDVERNEATVDSRFKPGQGSKRHALEDDVDLDELSALLNDDGFKKNSQFQSPNLNSKIKTVGAGGS